MKGPVAVIGAGPAGCAAAWELHKRGVKVVLFERESGVGGRTRSQRSAGRVLDTGAGFFTNFYPTLDMVLKELNLTDQVVALSRSNQLVQDGRACDMTLGSIRSFARFPFVGTLPKLRMAAATAWSMLRYRSLELSNPASLATVDDASVTDYARRMVGESAYQYFVRPGIEPFWYVECDQVSRALFVALQARAADAHFFTLRDGMDTVCRELQQQLPTVHLNATVTSLECRGSRVVVHTKNGESEFGAAIVATTASVAARLVSSLGDDIISDRQHAFLREQRYVPTIHCSYDVQASDCPRGASAAFPCGPGQHDVAAVGFNGKKGQGEQAGYGANEVVSIYLSAQETKRHLGESDAQLSDHSWQRARAFWPALPREGEPGTVIRHPQAIPVHAVGRYRKAAAFCASQAGPIRFAGDYLATATVDGALASGLAATVLSR